MERVKVLELYAGIGGFAAAIADKADVICAIDASSHVLEVYQHNFDHPTRQMNLLGDVSKALAAYEADMWWLSPPCTPHTRRGQKRDLDDRRSQTFITILDAISKVKPNQLGFENVEGFVGSDAQDMLHQTLTEAGYMFVDGVVCPSKLGMPNRRPRYYLTASLSSAPRPFDVRKTCDLSFTDILDAEPEPPRFVPDEIQAKYGGALLVVEPTDHDAETSCFTSAYGRSWVFSGSYVRTMDSIRFFSPLEVVRLLGFPEAYGFPETITRKKRWKYAGNSLSIPAVRLILESLDL